MCPNKLSLIEEPLYHRALFFIKEQTTNIYLHFETYLELNLGFNQKLQPKITIPATQNPPHVLECSPSRFSIELPHKCN